jgi:hypothetical protein
MVYSSHNFLPKACRGLVGPDLLKKVEFVFNQTLLLYLQPFFLFIVLEMSIIFPQSVHDPSQFLTFGIQENTLRQTMYARNVLQFHTMNNFYLISI